MHKSFQTILCYIKRTIKQQLLKDNSCNRWNIEMLRCKLAYEKYQIYAFGQLTSQRAIQTPVLGPNVLWEIAFKNPCMFLSLKLREHFVCRNDPYLRNTVHIRYSNRLSLLLSSNCGYWKLCWQTARCSWFPHVFAEFHKKPRRTGFKVWNKFSYNNMAWED